MVSPFCKGFETHFFLNKRRCNHFCIGNILAPLGYNLADTLFFRHVAVGNGGYFDLGITGNLRHTERCPRGRIALEEFAVDCHGSLLERSGDGVAPKRAGLRSNVIASLATGIRAALLALDVLELDGTEHPFRYPFLNRGDAFSILHLRGNRKLSARVEIPRGAAGRDAAETEGLVRKKFRDLATPFLDQDQVQHALDLIDQLEDLPNLSELSKCLCVP